MEKKICFQKQKKNMFSWVNEKGFLEQVKQKTC